jgi:ComF family protein
MFTRLYTSLLHLFYPHSCDACGKDLMHTEEILCLQCQHTLPVTNFQQYAENPVEKIYRGRTNIKHAMAGYYYVQSSPMQQLIHLFKYQGRKDIALYLGKQMGHMLNKSKWIHEIDCIVPVPLYRIKEKHRGYNQSTILANGIASVTQKPVFNNVLSRQKPTGTQTRKNRVARWQNVATVFAPDNIQSIKGQHVLLIDDVITTGATTEACSNILLTGNATVSICSLAVAYN